MQNNCEGVVGGSIRVLLATVGADLPNELEAVLNQAPNVQLVGKASGPTELLLAAQRGVDVIVIVAEVSYPPPGVCSHLLSEWPELRILVVSVSGAHSTLYWLGLRRRRLRSGIPTHIVDHIHTAVALDPTA
jgi:DNA-binding NarL/FixJ family response regulator